MAYATTADVEIRLGRQLDAAEAQIVDVRLNDAELLIESRVPDLADRVTAGDIKVGLVVMIEAEAVLRLIRNPEGYSEETDGNYSYTISQSVASGRLTIEDEEWALLGVRRKVYMIAPRVVLPTSLDEYNPNWEFEPDTAVWA